MNVDQILHTWGSEHVDYLLIGGMNFLLRHLPELTFDVDIWVRDDAENLERLNTALRLWVGNGDRRRLSGARWRLIGAGFGSKVVIA